MIIVKTTKELLDATSGSIVTYFVMKKKKSASELHEGISKSLENGRKYGNKAVVAFWYEGTVANFLDERFVSGYTAEWDRDGCIAWAQANNVDIVFVPDYTDEIVTFNVSNLQYYKDLSDKIWKDENYASMFTNPISSEKTKMHCIGKLITNSKFKHIFSSKDGISRFVEKHFMEKYTDSRAIITDPIKTTDGLYYSSSYFKYSQLEKNVVAQIEPAILSFDYSIPIFNLKTQINDFGKDVDLNVQYLDATSNEKILGPNSKLVDIKFSVGKDENIKYDGFAILM